MASGWVFLFLDTYLLTYLSICLNARVQASQPCPNTTPAGWAHRESLTTTSDWHNTLCRVGAPAKGKSQLSTTPTPKFHPNGTHTGESKEKVAAKFGSETCQEAVGMAISCLCLAGSRSRCKLLLRMLPQPRRRTGRLLSPPERRTKGWSSSRSRSNSTG